MPNDPAHDHSSSHHHHHHDSDPTPLSENALSTTEVNFDDYNGPGGRAGEDEMGDGDVFVLHATETGHVGLEATVSPVNHHQPLVSADDYSFNSLHNINTDPDSLLFYRSPLSHTYIYIPFLHTLSFYDDDNDGFVVCLFLLDGSSTCPAWLKNRGRDPSLSEKEMFLGQQVTSGLDLSKIISEDKLYPINYDSNPKGRSHLSIYISLSICLAIYLSI